MRFSDEKLQEFYDAYLKTDKRIEDHIKEEDAFRAAESLRHEKNEKMMEELVAKIDQIDQSTKGIVTLFREGEIGQKWVIRIGHLILWLAAIYGGVKLLWK